MVTKEKTILRNTTVTNPVPVVKAMPLFDTVMVKLRRSSSSDSKYPPSVYIIVKDREHNERFNKHHEFYLSETTLRAATPVNGSLAEKNDLPTIYACDAGSFVSLWYDPRIKKMQMQFSWLTTRGNEKLEGYRQTIYVPVDLINEYLDTGNTVKCICHEPDSNPKLIFAPEAHNRIRKIIALGGKRALTKFFRDRLKYKYTREIHITEDIWIKGFFFQQKNGGCGGIHPVETTTMGKDGKPHPRLYYDVAT